MEMMLFTSSQPEVKIAVLPDGKRDVTVLSNEELVSVENLSLEEPSKEIMFRYAGNQFRTVYDLSEEEILADLEKYLNYDSSEEPTMEQLRREQEIVDNYTIELMEAGLL